MQNDTEHYRPLMRLLVRLLGVYFVVEGVAALLGHGIDLVGQAKYTREMGVPFASWYALGWTLAAGFLVLAGLLLIFKSTIALDAIYYERLGDEEQPREPTRDDKPEE